MDTPIIRMGSALAAAALSMLAGLGTAQAAGPLDNPGFNKVITCSACHGQNGNSKSDMMPIIAGLDPAYFKKQIENYAAGKRLSPEMEPYAKEIQFLGLDEIAAFFAAQKREPTLIRVSPDAVAKGKVAAAPCAICHGNDGKGDAARLIPSLAGQPPGYLGQQMLLFKQDTRDPGDPLLAAKKAIMRVVPDSQFSDLAAYYSSLR
ncbi:MAG TPA: c-type cytochrome [Candidatus Acidoferrales bacterium]|nr:c-type cytochrome [Candidatus Acidoferrales bacterium]